MIMTKMNVDAVRQHCLSFPHTTEKLQWGETLCFKVQGEAKRKAEAKIFALMNLDAVPPGLCIKCSPERFAELTEIEGIVPAPYVGRYNWVLLENLDVLPARDIEDLIAESYEMVVTKMNRTKMNPAKIKPAIITKKAKTKIKTPRKKTSLVKTAPKKKTKRGGK
jgi:predicted DNA-binding protein (MmcQ/YjbR family)